MSEQQRIEGVDHYAVFEHGCWLFFRKGHDTPIFPAMSQPSSAFIVPMYLEGFDATARHFLSAGREAERERINELADDYGDRYGAVHFVREPEDTGDPEYPYGPDNWWLNGTDRGAKSDFLEALEAAAIDTTLDALTDNNQEVEEDAR